MIERSLRSGVARRAALASLAMLILAQALDAWVRGAPLGIYLLRILPLAVFLPGLIRDQARTYIWLCFVILLYFLTVVLRLFYNPADPVAWVAMASIVVFFNAGMLYVRWRSQELRAGATAEISEVERS
ncbi:MAG: DUF2069 domain-containing protein [Halieaceae bacterium]|jgi:uncharacterized membrane protein|nr:DUF2069 domain-containing protein [Halieaceae bacterium]